MNRVRDRESGGRVGLNGHLLSLAQTYRGAGINGYIYQLLHHLPALDSTAPALEYVAFLHDPAFAPPPGLCVVRSTWNTSGPWRRIAWEQTGLAVASRRLDLLHGLAFATPIAVACPTVVTVHDLSFLRFPEAFRPFNRTYLKLITRRSTRRAARVIAVSESTRNDVIALCGVPPARVITVPNGVSELFTPGSDGEVAAFRERLGLPERFILFVGTLEPRKNIVTLVEAYARVRAADPGAPPLVVAGGKGWFYDNIFGKVQELGLTGSVHFPGFIAAEQLRGWYSAADVFVYPSLFEGFGLPVLEAMACGTPVITSTSSSLPEVLGDAGLAVAPHDVQGLADAIARLLADKPLREELAVRGLRRSRLFTWDRTARETAQVYSDVLQTSRQEAAR